ncbi:MAG: mechanosensitive ion channel family protein [Chlamydiales bacterium]|nr:mechanosensitive ion channel family protein [Chlamydiales bacterium]
MWQSLHFLSTSSVGEILLILLLAFLFSYASKRLINYLLKRSIITVWLKAFLESLLKPLQVLIWIIALIGVGEALFADPILSKSLEGFDFFSKDKLSLFRKVSLVIFISVVFLKWKKRITQLFTQKAIFKEHIKEIDEALFVALSKLLTVVTLVLTILMTLDSLGVPIQTLIAFGGIGTFAISLAGKDVVANLFGGLVIYINRPFSVGNWINSPNKGFEGVVEDIGWYMTRIRTFARRPMYIPNAIITEAIIENPGRMYNRRIKADIGVRYEDISKVQAITDQIDAMVRNHPDIDTKQFILIDFVEFASSSLNINVYCFTKTTKWAEYRKIQQDVFLKIAKIVDDNGAEIAFPTRTLHIEGQDITPPEEKVSK